MGSCRCSPVVVLIIASALHGSDAHTPIGAFVLLTLPIGAMLLNLLLASLRIATCLVTIFLLVIIILIIILEEVLREELLRVCLLCVKLCLLGGMFRHGLQRGRPRRCRRKCGLLPLLQSHLVANRALGCLEHHLLKGRLGHQCCSDTRREHHFEHWFGMCTEERSIYYSKSYNYLIPFCGRQNKNSL